MCELLWELCVAVVKHRAHSMVQHADSLPGPFVLLVVGKKE